MCFIIIDCRIDCSKLTIPMTKPNSETMPGCNVNTKHEREQSLFWHWVWSEMGKSYNGVVYDLMKRSRHTYCSVAKNKIVWKNNKDWPIVFMTIQILKKIFLSKSRQ